MKLSTTRIAALLGMFFLASASLHAEDIDGLYASFEKTVDRSYIQMANNVLEDMGDTTRFTPDMDRYDVHSLLLRHIIDHYRKTQNYIERTKYLHKAVDLYKEAKDSMNLAGCYHSLGTTYQILGAFDEAIEASNHSSEVLEAIGGNNGQRVRYVLNNMAQIYVVSGDLEKGEEMYLRCLDMLEKGEVDQWRDIDKSEYLGNLAQVYTLMGKPDKAIPLGEEALQLITDAKGEVVEVAERQLGLASAYIAGKEFKKASGLLDKADASLAPVGMEYMKSRILFAYADLNESSGKKAEAERNLDDAIKISRENGYKDIELQSLEKRLGLLRKSNPAKALDDQDRMYELKDSIYSERQKVMISDFQVKYETLDKELQIVAQKAKTRAVQNVLCALISMLVLIILGAIYIAVLLKRSRKANKLLKEANDTKQRLFAIISHDIKNPAHAIRNTLTGLVKNAEYLSKEEINQINVDLLSSAESHVALINNLLDWSKVQTGQVQCNPSDVNVDVLVSDVIATLEPFANYKGVPIKKEIPADMTIYADRNLVTIMLRNLLSNAIKFSKKDETITFIASETENEQWISVKDNGMGFDPKDIKRQTGTDGEVGSGIGLVLCRDFMAKNNGKLDIESEPGKGSNITLQFPKHHES